MKLCSPCFCVTWSFYQGRISFSISILKGNNRMFTIYDCLALSTWKSYRISRKKDFVLNFLIVVAISYLSIREKTLKENCNRWSITEARDHLRAALLGVTTWIPNILWSQETQSDRMFYTQFNVNKAMIKSNSFYTVWEAYWLFAY